MSPMDSVMRIVTSLPFLLFIVVSILNAVLRGRRKSGVDKELLKKSNKANMAYDRGPAEDKALTKPQGKYAKEIAAKRAKEQGYPQGSYVQSTTAVRPEVQDPRIKRKSENKKERRGMDTDSELVAQAYYVDANEQDWSFEADNKPRKTPVGFDR